MFGFLLILGLAQHSQTYPTPYLGSREFSRTCLAPGLDMSGPSSLNPGYVPLTGHIQSLGQVPETVAEHVWPQTRTCLGL
jgi:hypothetical protein